MANIKSDPSQSHPRHGFLASGGNDHLLTLHTIRMKAKFKSFYRWYLSGWVLLAVALFLFQVILIPGMFVQILAVLATIYVYRKPVVFEEEQGWVDTETKRKEIRDPFQWLNHVALHLAIAVDKLSNVMFSYLLDLLFTDDDIIEPYRAGNHRDTISEFIGRNKQLGTLTWFGRLVDNVLHLIDPGHSENSIE